MLTQFHKSTGTLTATVTDVDGVAASGATVTVTIVDHAGTALVTDAAMADQSDGTYDYTISNTLLAVADRVYTAQITAVSGGSTRYAEIKITTEIDAD